MNARLGKLHLYPILAALSNDSTDERIGRIVKAIAEARGLDPTKWHPHLLRHACATHTHDHDAPLQALAAWLGHARLSTAGTFLRTPIRD
jgi:site-specific recombinase XerD